MNDTHLLKTPLPTASLIPIFVTVQEEAYLLTKIEELGGTPIEDVNDHGPDGAEGTSSSRRFKSKSTGWKEVKGRR